MNFEIPVKIKADSPEFIPQYKTSGAAAADILANIPANEQGNRTVILLPNKITAIDSGFSLDIPEGWEIQIRTRSGWALKGLQVTNSPGTIDCDYTGRIKIILNNTSENIITINHGDRIAQLLIMPSWKIKWVTTDNIDKITARASGGFGSTGLGE